MKYEYLKDLGIKKPNNLFELAYTKSDKKEIKKYGACWRDTSNFDTTIIYWLYNHLKHYYNKAIKIIDMTTPSFTYNNDTKTQKEAIEFILNALENSIKFDMFDNGTDILNLSSEERKSYLHDLDNKEKQINIELQTALHWLSVIFFSLWI